MAIKADFEIKLHGEGITSYMQNHCLKCGWTGKSHYAHNDWQITNLNDEKREHKCNDK